MHVEHCPPNAVAAVSAPCAVTNGSDATITCSPKAVGETPAVWPEGDFYVDMTAEASTGLAGCSNTLNTSRQVNVTKKPNLAITAPSSTAICSDNKALLLSYTVVDQANSGQTISLAPPQSCQVTGPDAAGKAEPCVAHLHS